MHAFKQAKENGGPRNGQTGDQWPADISRRFDAIRYLQGFVTVKAIWSTSSQIFFLLFQFLSDKYVARIMMSYIYDLSDYRYSFLSQTNTEARIYNRNRYNKYL